MAFADLREYLTALEKTEQLSRVKKKVSPIYELPAVIERTISRQGPALLFENVEGSDIPLVGNLFTTREMIAFALGWQEKDLLHRWMKCLDEPIPPVMVKTGPCKEVHISKPDLTHFPIPVLWHEGDGGPYITFAQFVTKDPDTGRRNVGIYRLEVKGPTRVGASIAFTHHGAVNQKKNEMRGRDCEFALAIGTEPASYLATQATVGHGEDEYALAGALRGEPLELVRCETVDLEVPAHAEIVMEGKILAKQLADEGPFGEWTGFVSGRAPRPVAEIMHISHRKNPIYTVAYEGYPVYGLSTILQQVAREPEWFRVIRSQTCPTIKDIHITLGGCACLIAIVSIRKTAEGQAKNVILDLLREPGVKVAIIVDDDIDIRNMDMVQWALATRMQPASDVLVIPEAAGMRLDPSQPDFPSGITSKMGIDATWPINKEIPARAKVPDDMAKRVAQDWDSYGIILGR
jgi:2,5-furandicarboxylate decarboxylase 1